MQTPSNACRRSRSPSTTLTLMRSVSPGPKFGIWRPSTSFSTCSFSSVCRRFIVSTPRIRHARARQIFIPKVGASQARRLFPLLPAPGADPRMVAREQNLRHLTALPFGGARVVRVLQKSLLEALLEERLRLADDGGQEPH